MGTSGDSLWAGDCQVAFVLLIEGYHRAITTWADTAAVATAYAATDWSLVVGGMLPPGEISERLELFKSQLDTPSLRVVVAPDDTDLLASEFFATGYATEQTYVVSRSGSTYGDLSPTGTVLAFTDDQAFTDGAEIHIGTECVELGSYQAAGGELPARYTGCIRGKYAPFKADSESDQRYGRAHYQTTSHGIAQRIRATSAPRTWVGRMARVLAHVVRGGVLDAFAQAETIFVGTVEDVRDSELGHTIFDLVHVNDLLCNTVLLAQQMSGVARSGIYLDSGVKIICQEDARSGSATSNYYDATLTVVASGASGVTQIDQGWYSVDEIMSALTACWAADTWAGCPGLWRVSTDAGKRIRFGVDEDMPSGTYINGVINLRVEGCCLCEILGWPAGTTSITTNLSLRPQTTAPAAPLRVRVPQGGAGPDLAITYNTIGLDPESISGSYVDMESDTDWLPERLRRPTVGSNTYLEIGGWGYVVATHVDDVTYTQCAPLQIGVATWLGIEAGSLGEVMTIAEGQEGSIPIKQIVLLEGDFYGLFTRLVASTGAATYNQATYDTFPRGVGAAIPWECLGDTWTRSFNNLQGIYRSTSFVVIDKPTKLGDLLLPELLLRNAQLITRGPEIKCVMPSEPTALTVTYALDESSKATPADTDDLCRSSSIRQRDLIRNQVTIEYNRRLDGGYRDKITLTNGASISDHGGAIYAMTLHARNILGATADVTPQIDALAAHVGGLVLGLFSDEVIVVKRTIARTFFGLHPGDTVTLTDAHVRNPLTGARGLSAFPGWIWSVTRDWSTGCGEIEVLLTATEDPGQRAIYSPAAGVTTYDTDQGMATLASHDYSYATEAADITHFAEGDLVRFIEVSPADPAAPSTWVDEIDSIVLSNVITVNNNGLGVYDPTLNYVMISDDWTTATATQKTKAYLAEADGLIASSSFARVWSIPEIESGSQYDWTTTRQVSHRYPANLSDDDGEPCSPFHHQSALHSANNLLSYRCATQLPYVPGDLESAGWFFEHTSTSSTLWHLLTVMPLYLGRMSFRSPSFYRQLQIAPTIWRTSGTHTVYCRITLSKDLPRGTSTVWHSVTFGDTYRRFADWEVTDTTRTLQQVNAVQPLPYETQWLSVEVKATSGEKIAVGSLERCYLTAVGG